MFNKMNVKINYITDGDIAGAFSVIGENPKNDIYYSTGGAPEGVISSCCTFLLWWSNTRKISFR